jgi:outer membrane biosynthesis protein TonB
MGRLSAALLALLLAAVAALGLAACGGSDADLLPGDTASEITSNLDQVRNLVAEEECEGAADAAQEVSAQVDALGGVDEKLKQALQKGATRLNEVVAECEEAPEEETEPAVETAVEPEDEEEEKKEKPEKDEKEKPEKDGEEEAEEAETPTPPSQAEGKAKGQEPEQTSPPETEAGGTSAGGVSAGAPVEGPGE